MSSLFLVRRPFFAWSVNDLALTTILGAVGLSLNYVPVDLGWGLHLLFGSAFSLLSLRVLAPANAILSIAIASLATVTLWHHPWASIVWIVEGAFLAVLLPRIPPILRDALYWLVLGGPLLVATYGGVLHVEGRALILVVAKQSINGILNVWIAELIYASVLFVPTVQKRLKLRAMSALELAMMVLATLALAPLPFQVWFNSISSEQKATDLISLALKHEVTQVQRLARAWFEHRVVGLEILAASVVRSNSSVIDVSNLGALADEFSQVIILDGQKHVLAAYNASPSTFQIMQNIAPGQHWRVEAEPSVDARRAAGFLLSVYVSRFDITVVGRIPSERPRHIVEQTRLAPGTAMAILNPEREATVVWGSESLIQEALEMVKLQKHPIPAAQPVVLTKEGFGKSLMSHVSGAVMLLRAGGALVKGWDLIAVAPLADQVDLARRSQLSALLLQLGLLTVLLGASYVAGRYLADKLAVLDARLAPLSFDKETPQANGPWEPVREFNELRERTENLGEKLKEERAELESYQKRLETLEAYAPIVIYQLGLVGTTKAGARVNYISSSISRVSGYSKEEILHPLTWANAIHPMDREETLNKFSHLHEGKTVSAEYRFRCADGAFRWFYDVLTVGRRSQADRASPAIGFVIDVTARKEAQQQVIQASKLASLGEMATGMAHEINQPLNVIKLSASNMSVSLEQGRTDPGKLMSQLKGIVSQVDRAAGLIDHLRLFGRFPNEDVSLVSLLDAIDGARSLVVAAMRSKSVEVVVDSTTDPILVTGHPTLIEQVFLNLILNARDAIEDRQRAVAGLKGRISISMRRAPIGWVTVTVDDNGGGISGNALEHLFEPFFTTKAPGKGTGLGLSVSYGVVRDMGGTISAETVGEGARFTIVIPEAKSEPLLPAPDDPETPNPTGEDTTR